MGLKNCWGGVNTKVGTSKSPVQLKDKGVGVDKSREGEWSLMAFIFSFKKKKATSCVKAYSRVLIIRRMWF